MKKLFEVPEVECYKIVSEAVTDNEDGSVEGGGDTTSLPEGWT